MDKIDPGQTPSSLRETASKVFKFLGAPFLFGLCLAGFGLILFGTFASEVFEGETTVFDEGVRALAQQLATPNFTKLMIFVSILGAPGFLTALGIPTAIGFLYLKWKRAFVLFAITMLGEIALNFILKALFHRTRSVPFFDYVVPSSYSFPSGHALGSFCFYGVLTLLITARIENRPVIWSLRILSLFLILSVGFSRVYLGVHYASDVLAGYLTAFLWIATVILGDSFLLRLERIDHKK